jgi:pyruvate dehydrogenase E1 component alpha subunit
VENNLYAVMSDRSVRRSESFDFSKLINGLGANYYKSDGNNFFDVYNTTKIAIKETFNTMKPSVIEFVTFRHMGHSGPVIDDEIGYRKQDDWDTRIKNCPLRNLKNKIIKMGIASPDTLNKIEEKIKYEIDDAIRFAEESPFPKPEDIMEGVYNE